MGLFDSLFGSNKAQKNALKDAKAATGQMYMQPFAYQGPGGAYSGVKPGTSGGSGKLMSPGGKELVVGPDGRVVFKQGGGEYKGDNVIQADGTPVALGKGGQFPGYTGMNAPGFDYFSNIGDLDPVRAQMLQAAMPTMMTAMQQLPDAGGLQNAQAFADQMALGAIPDANKSNLLQQESQLNRAAQPFMRRANSDVFAGLRGGFESAAGEALNQARQGFGGAEENRLNLLRERAREQESRGMDDLQARLHAQGRLGTEGGARAFQAFGKAMSDADLDRQLAAQDLGRQLLNDTSGRAQMFAGTGADLQNLATQTRLQNLAGGMGALGQAADLNQMMFGRDMSLADLQRLVANDVFGRAGGVFDAQRAAAGTGFDMSQALLDNVLKMNQEGRLNLGMGMEGESLRMSGANSAGNNLTNIAGMTPSKPGILGGMLSGFGSIATGLGSGGFNMFGPKE